MKTRKGLGKGLGTGYKNLAPMDSHIHSLSAKGVSTWKKVSDTKYVNKKRKGTLYLGKSTFTGKPEVSVQVDTVMISGVKFPQTLINEEFKTKKQANKFANEWMKSNDYRKAMKVGGKSLGAKGKSMMGKLTEQSWNAMSITERRKLLNQIEPDNKEFIKYLENKKWEDLMYDVKWFLDGTVPLSDKIKSDTAFKKAIKSGRLSENPKAKNYVGNYMWMGKYGGKDEFKDSMTRKYLPESLPITLPNTKKKHLILKGINPKTKKYEIVRFYNSPYMVANTKQGKKTILEDSEDFKMRGYKNLKIVGRDRWVE